VPPFCVSACALVGLLIGDSIPVKSPAIARTESNTAQNFLAGCDILFFTSEGWDFDTEVYQNWINIILVTPSILADMIDGLERTIVLILNP
jgi:hypothetical protein